jgi:hypothetical protein
VGVQAPLAYARGSVGGARWVGVTVGLGWLAAGCLGFG